VCVWLCWWEVPGDYFFFQVYPFVTGAVVTVVETGFISLSPPLRLKRFLGFRGSPEHTVGLVFAA